VGDVADGRVDQDSGQRGRRIRGAILIGIVLTGAVIWAAAAIPADRHAGSVRHKLTAAVQGYGYERLAVAGPNGDLKDLDKAAGTQVWVFAGMPAVVKAEASQWWTFWQPRCVIVAMGQDGRAHSSVVKTPDCFKARVPAD
jgi:hypothetical protein